MATATQSEFAAMLGKDKSYVTRLKQAGRLVMSADGKVDVEQSHARIAATADPSKEHVADRHVADRHVAGRSAPDQPRGVDPVGNSFQQAKAVREKYGALQAKVEYERTIGKLIDRDEVNQALEDVVNLARQSVENLPHRVAATLVGKDFDQIVALLRQEIVAMMGDTHKEVAKRLAELGRVEV